VSTPRWYRGTPPWLWGMVVALALALALWLAGWSTVGAIRASERAKVMAEGDALTRMALARGDALARQNDSLRAVVTHVDTVLVERIRRVRDTAWLPADTAPVVVLAACRAQLDTLATDCDTYRRTATLALAQADTTRRRDSAAVVGLSLQLAAMRRADSVRASQQSRRSRLRLVTDGVCAGAVAGHLFQWSTR
jgi:hypothetical protein